MIRLFSRRRPAQARIEGPAITAVPALAFPTVTVTLDADTAPAADSLDALRAVSGVTDRAAAAFSTIGAGGTVLDHFAGSAASRTRSQVDAAQYAEDEVNNLTAVVRPGAVFVPGTYRVTYNRIGRYGRHGTPAPVPLTTHATTLGELRDAITDDAEIHLEGATPDVLVDMQVMGGTIRAQGGPAGTFALRLVAPGIEPTPGQETTGL